MWDWKGWENSGLMKLVDVVVKEYCLFIVLVVFKKKVRLLKGKYIKYMYGIFIIWLFFIYL